MATPVADLQTDSAIEHDRSSVPRGHTGWHHFLGRALEGTKAEGFEVHCFVKLGTLPLEADIILLHLDEKADLHKFRQHFEFLLPVLRRYVVLEYKSPEDALKFEDFDTVRAYAMLCKRKYQVERDQEVSVAMLYSRTEPEFFARCAEAGFPFHEIQPGVQKSSTLPMGFFTVDLASIGEQNPEHPINLVSSRRKQYAGQAHPETMGPFAVLYDEIFLREIKKMSQLQIPGNEQVLSDAERTVKRLIRQSSLEDRLDGIPAEDRLRGLPLEDRLRGLPPSDTERTVKRLIRQGSLEDRLDGIPVEERLRGLSEGELARLRELLLTPGSR